MTRPTAGAGTTSRDSADARGFTSIVVLPTQPSSLMLGRNVVLAWLQAAPQPYAVDTTLLLVTELLSDALASSDDTMVLTVRGVATGMRVEVRHTTPTGPTAQLIRAYDDSRHLQMVTSLAARWGLELVVTDGDVPERMAWFECDPVDATEPSRVMPTIPRPRRVARH